MTPAAVRTLIDLPLFRLTLEDTQEFLIVAGVNLSENEALLAIGPFAFIAEWGRD